MPTNLELTQNLAQALAPSDPAPTVKNPTLPLSGLPGNAPTLPGYRITHELARGGMGQVWAAVDLKLDREVAIKTLLPEANAQRFVTEAKITAQLPHPGIPPVHALGTLPNGLPWLAMKLIHGQTLATLLQNRERARPALPQFIQIFEQIAQAVGFAHAQGIIHRDLKPLNVMVGAFGEVQVMDWGLAKTLSAPASPERRPGGETPDSPDLTRAGAIMGTPGYMAPEQARGEPVDARADVFALGSILAMILTGKPAVTGSSVTEVVERTAAGDLAEAVARLDACGADADLSAIAKQCLAVEATARPADARVVAEQVAAYRAGVDQRLRQAETDHARAEMQAAEQAKRRRVVRAAIALVLSLLFLGLLALGLGFARVSNLNAVLQVRNHELDEARTKALASAQAAQERAAEANTVLDFVEDRVFAAARPKDQEGGLGYDVQLKEALFAALPHVEPGFKNKPLIEARLRMVLGVSFMYLSKEQVAAEQFRRSRALFLQHLGPIAPQTLRATNNLATALDRLGQHTQALRLREETLQKQVEQLGTEHEDTLASLNNLAVSYYTLGRVAESLKIGEQLLVVRQRLLGPNHPDTLLAMHNVARSYTGLGQPARAVPMYEEMLARQQASLGQAHPDTLLTAHSLAITYAVLGQHSDALKLSEQTLKLRQQVLGPEHADTLSSMQLLASQYANLKRRAEAITLLEQTLALQRLHLDPNNTSLLLTMMGLAEQYAAIGRHDDALKLREETLALQKERFGANHPQTLLGMLGLARSLVQVHRLEQAESLLDDCIRRAEKAEIPIDLYATILSDRVKLCVQRQDAAGCQVVAETWEKLNRTDADSLYHAACLRGISAGLQTKSTRPDASRLAQEEANRAMDWLRKAIASGFRDATHLKNDQELAPLRHREDFKKLLADLEANRK